jgi:hypothetical protein
VKQGRFTHTQVLPATLLPGKYSVSVTSVSDVAIRYQGPATVKLASPATGIAGRPYLTINASKGPRALQVSPGAGWAWVHFPFLARPARGQHIRLVWYRDGKLYYENPKPNGPSVDSYLKLQPGVAHHNWRVDLMVGKTVVRQLSFRWR